jgi:aminopeptidase N
MTTLLANGVSHRLAIWRAARYSNVRYRIDARINDEGTQFSARIVVDVDLSKRSRIILDWRADRRPALASLRVNGVRCADAVYADGHLIIPLGCTRVGTNQVEINCAAPIAASGYPLIRYEDPIDHRIYVYSLFVPVDASCVFPCFDQPDLKARFTLSLSVPRGWTAISNAPLAVRHAQSHQFHATAPISSYLFAFAAGPWVAVRSTQNALYARRSQRRALQSEAPRILAMERAATRELSRYLARAFPFDKHDLVLIPEFAFGGMEHAGATFLREDLMLLLRARAGSAATQRRAQLLFHETAHQWMGNLVTMRWFDDLWLKEGFANFLAAHLLERIPPRQNGAAFLRPIIAAALREDASGVRQALQQPLGNLLDAKSLYGPIVYGKGPALLRQLEYAIGATRFRAVARRLVKAHAYDAFSSRDLVAALEAVTMRSWQAWASAWIARPGRPVIRALKRPSSARAITQRRLLEQGRWPQRIEVTHGGTPERGYTLLNTNDRAYGEFLIDSTSLRNALADTAKVARDPVRRIVWDGLWREVEGARVAPIEFLSKAIASLDASDATFSAGLLARIEIAFRRYLDPKQQESVSQALEQRLLDVMQRRQTSIEARVVFGRTYVAVMRSPQACGRALDALNGVSRSPGTQTVDRLAVAQRLVVLGYLAAGRALKLLPYELRARARIVLTAASPNLKLKTAILRNIIDGVEGTEDEFERALPVLFAPEHATMLQPLLRRALKALPTLHAHRKIFFVNRWLDAISGIGTDHRVLTLIDSINATGTQSAELRGKLQHLRGIVATTVRIRQRFASVHTKSQYTTVVK